MKYLLNLRVLCVEDHEGIATVIKHLLNSVSYAKVDFYHASSLEEAIKRLKRYTYDIILLDLNLPESSGLETLRKVQKATQTPIIVITGEEDYEIRVEVIREGVHDCIFKPNLSSEVLWRSIRFAVIRILHMREIEETLKTVKGTINYVEQVKKEFSEKGKKTKKKKKDKKKK